MMIYKNQNIPAWGTLHPRSKGRVLVHRAAAMLLCLFGGIAGATAQTYLTFDENVRYSQLAIESGLYDFYGNKNKMGFDTYDANGNKTADASWAKTRSFDYVPGLVGKATMEAALYYGTDWAKPWYYAAQGYATGTPFSSQKKAITLDNLNGVKMYLAMLATDNSWAGTDAKSTATTNLTQAIDSLKKYNQNYYIGNATYSGISESSANDTQKKMIGGWFHKPSDYVDQMWCDGLYMGAALMAQISKYKDSKTTIDSSDDWAVIAKQFTISWEQLYNSTTGLLYHAFTANPGDTYSDDWEGITKNGTTYHSAAYWARANAWYFMALVDVLEQMSSDNTNYSTLKGYLTSLAAGLKKYQDATTGGWYQVLDQKDTALDGNYIEGSATCIITAAYLKAIRLGLLTKDDYEATAKAGYKACVEQFMVYNSSDNSKVQLINSCASAGLGGSDKRSGSRSYYITGKDVTKTSTSTSPNEGKILGGFILAATEYERAYLDKSTHAILFTRPVQNNNNVLSADASTTLTSGTITYQWYKQASTEAKANTNVLRAASSADTKIDGATNATYTATQSGNYYVIASDGTNSVTSSVMTVTVADSGDSGDDSGTTTETGSVELAADGENKNSTWSKDGYAAAFGTDASAQKNYVKVAKGKSVTLTITPPLGVSITKVVLDYGTSTSTYSGTQVTFTLPSTSSDTSIGTVAKNSDGSVVITFANTSSDIYASKVTVYYGGSTPSTTTYTITSAVNDANMGSVAITKTTGSESVTSGSSVDAGTALTLTATANDGYEFDTWSATGTTGTASDNVYTISSIAANTTVTATFKAKTSTKTQLTASFATTTATVAKGTTSYDLPALTVKAGETTLTATTDYTVSYQSGNTTVATSVADGKITLASDQTGDAVITATVTPTNTDTYEGTTATFTITVAEELPTTYTYKVDKSTTYSRNQSIWVTDNDGNNVARVVLGGWMFPNAIPEKSVYGGKCTGEGLGVSGQDWGKASELKTSDDEYISDFTAQVGEGSNKNARQEQGSNAQPGSTGLYNGSMVSQGTIRDAMFNVPCSGAYLVYTAKVPGSITSVIFQNGVFDQSSSNITYRPQRRVFVMDEAGKIVPCTATLKNTNGKLPANDFSKYSWDLGTMPTDAAGVQAHFVGLTDFSIESSSFTNGVYESNLSYDVCKNEVLKDETLKDVTGKGYRGWSILADGPVAYTFDVLPGKTYYIYNYGSRIGFYGFTFTPKSDVTTDEVALKEDGSTTITKTEEGHMAQVSLDRTFKGGIWNSCVLPFSMNKQQIDEIFGTTYSIGNADGTQIIYFDEVKNDSVYFVRHAYNNIVAGKPFLIKPSKTGDIKIDFTDSNSSLSSDFVYKYVTIENTKPEDWCADDNWAWVSSYEKGTVYNGDHFIGSGNGNLIGLNRESGQVGISAFRGFLKAKTPASKAKVNTLLVANADNTYGVDEGEPTAIVRLEMDADGNYVERPATGRIYNVNGQVVSNDAAALSTLPSGIYIVNGKKYIK